MYVSVCEYVCIRFSVCTKDTMAGFGAWWNFGTSSAEQILCARRDFAIQSGVLTVKVEQRLCEKQMLRTTKKFERSVLSGADDNTTHNTAVALYRLTEFLENLKDLEKLLVSFVETYGIDKDSVRHVISKDQAVRDIAKSVYCMSLVTPGTAHRSVADHFKKFGVILDVRERMAINLLYPAHTLASKELCEARKLVALEKDFINLNSCKTSDDEPVDILQVRLSKLKICQQEV